MMSGEASRCTLATGCNAAMARVSAVLRSSGGGYAHMCPGCRGMHYITVDRPNHCGARWSFDGNLDAPTFSPSVNISIPADAEGQRDPFRCHYFLRAGMIEFLGDCTHALAGQTVALPHLPDERPNS